MESSERVQAYRTLQRDRIGCLQRHAGKDSNEEDAILDRMDPAWYALTTSEQEYLRADKGPLHREVLRLLDLGGE
jgi:hypothetical protein